MNGFENNECHEHEKNTMSDEMNSNLQAQLEEFCDADLPVAWVFGSSINALSFVRSLGRKKVRCIVFDDSPMIAASSRYATFVKASVAELSSDSCLRVLADVARKSRYKPVIFATSDAHNEFLAHSGYQLEDLCDFCIPDPITIDALIDKKKQYETAKKVGIPVPLCIYPPDVEFIKENQHLFNFPCIIKPCTAHRGRQLLNGKKVKVVQNIVELGEAWGLLGDAVSEFMVQEVIPGGDSGLYGYLAFWSRDGEEVAWITKQKLRQNPPIYGDGALQVAIDAPEVRELSIRLLKEFGYKGFVGVEFKLDPRDEIFKLMEINPRTVSGNQLAISAGIDFPYIGYQYLTGAQFSYSGTFKRGTQFVNEDWDFRSCITLRKTNEGGLWNYMKDLYFSESKAIWAPDDLGPVWLTVSTVFGDFSRKVRRLLK
jgi:predicted ATP-grasp superfamily ATP-dependent carboligase